MRPRRVRAAAAVLAGLLAACAPSSRTLDWETVGRLIAAEFPAVPSLTTAELAALLADGARKVVLLDAREVDEFRVSRLPGAVHAASDAEAGRLAAADPEAVVVAYCSVGYRSAALASRLRARGHANVVNLEGSLFRWAGEGRPVHRDGARVEEVHPYDETWGALLPERLWAFEPGGKVP